MMPDHPDNVPKVAILFKGKPKGRIYRRLHKYKLKKDWMKIQVQKAGSYRSEDMVEALDWMLPVASSPEESIIVLLDWFPLQSGSSSGFKAFFVSGDHFLVVQLHTATAPTTTTS